jgi:hypothetical protein
MTAWRVAEAIGCVIIVVVLGIPTGAAAIALVM